MSLLASNAAVAGPDFQPYVSVFAGASLPNTTRGVWNTATSIAYDFHFKTGYILGGAVGAKWNDMFRSEVELSHSNWSPTDAFNFHSVGTNQLTGSVAATYLLGNVWLDVPTNSAFTPYVGGGVGVGWANVDLNFGGYGPNGSYTALAYQLGAGVKFNVNDKVDIDLGYRFKSLGGGDAPNINLAAPGNYHIGSISSHNFQVGLTYHF